MSRGACPEENESCKYFNTPDGCFTDLHHPDFPRKDYTTPLEKRYRTARAFQACRMAHDLIHLDVPPPKPSVPDMRAFLQERADGTA